MPVCAVWKRYIKEMQTILVGSHQAINCQSVQVDPLKISGGPIMLSVCLIQL